MVVASARAAATARELHTRAFLAGSVYLPAIATFCVLTAVGVAGGGFRPLAWRLGALALLALAAAALVTRDQIALRRREWTMLVAFAGLTAWTAASAAWSIHPSDSVLEAERTLLYLAAVATVLLALERAALAQVVTGAVAGITTVSAVGLAEHYLVTQPPNALEGELLFQPLGYANALGLYAAIGILLSCGLALAARRWKARAAALVPCLVLVPTLSLTSSRGAWVALPVGAAVTVYLTRLVRSRALVLALLAAGVALGVLIGSNRGQALDSLGANRPHYWRVALDEYQSSPVLGSGAGTFGDYFWNHRRPDTGFTLDAHNLYLQALAELGPVGLVLLAAALCLPLGALRRRQDPLVAAAAGAYLAFLLHAAIDWDWKVPALTIAGLFCGAIVLVGTRRGEARTISRRTRGVLLGVAVALSAVALGRAAAGPEPRVLT